MGCYVARVLGVVSNKTFRSRGAWCLSALAWLAMPASSTAQTNEPAHTVLQTNPHAGSVIFLRATDLPDAVSAGLFDALEAQLSGTGTTLHWQPMDSPGTDLRAAIERGKPAAAEHASAGVFWLDPSGESDWLLYLMDAAGERILVRRMEAAAHTPLAAIEAVSVIVRESATALIAGQPIAMDPLATPIQPPASPTPTPATDAADDPTAPTPPEPIATDSAAPTAPSDTTSPGMFRFAAGYTGSPLSKHVPWQHGLDLHVSMFTRSGVFVGVAYTLLPGADAEGRVNGQPFALTIQRHPARVVFGYASALSTSWRFDSEASAIVDIATRSTVSTPESTQATNSDTSAIFGLGLLARLTWSPHPHFELYVGLGVEAFFNRFKYVAERDGELRAILSPWPVVPSATLGVAFRP